MGIGYDSYILYTQEINISKLVFRKLLLDVNIRELRIDDFIVSNCDYYNGRKMKIYSARFEDPSFKSYGVFHKNELIYSCWISLRKFEMSVPSNFKLDENQGLLIDAYCHPEYRGYGLHSYMNNYRLKQIKQNGKDLAVVIVLNENIPAKKSQEKVGFVKTGVISYIRILNYELTKIK